MTRHYVTTGSAAFLPRLKVLLGSMRRHCGTFQLHLLAEGEEVARWGHEQRDVACTPVAAFLGRHPDLAPERLPGPPRPARELAWTWRWSLAADLLLWQSDPVVVIDADLMFWGWPEPVFKEIGAAPMAVLPHAFAPRAAGLPGVTYETHRRYGLYNAGFVYFAALGPARHMADLCREGPLAEDRRHADGIERWGEQGCLEYVAHVSGVYVIQHPAAAPGPWNAHTQALTVAHGGSVFFGGRPLVAYHYQSFRPGPGGQLADPAYEISPRQAEVLYAPYAAALAASKG